MTYRAMHQAISAARDHINMETYIFRDDEIGREMARLLLDKRLLTDTAMPVTDVAYASGFRSLRRFNALFKQRYRLQPTRLRQRMKPEAAPASDALQFELSYRPPYDWEAVSAFLGARAIAGVESVEGGRYRRTARIEVDGKAQSGWIEVAPSAKKPALRVTVSASLAKALPPPDYTVEDVPLTDPIFHSMIEVKRVPQVSSIGFWRATRGRVTSERGEETAVPNFRAMRGRHGRIFAVMTHNTDVTNSWERETEDPAYFLQFSVEGYALGVNVLLYAMTH